MDTSQIAADVVWVHAGTQDYYLDPAASAFPFGILPGMRPTPAASVAPSPAAKSSRPRLRLPSQATTIRAADLELDSDGQATGKLRRTLLANGSLRREQSREEDEAGRRKSIGDEIQGWLPAGSTYEVTAITDWDNKDKALHVEGTAKSRSRHSRRTPRWSRLRRFKPAGGSLSSRKTPLPRLFQLSAEEIDDVELEVPAEFKIESVPPARQAKPGVVPMRFSAAPQGNVVEVKRQLVLDGMAFPVTSYPALRNFFNTVKTDDDAQIVLQNAESAKNN